jgi:tetratricopeptide (TPR) repeat protein
MIDVKIDKSSLRNQARNAAIEHDFARAEQLLTIILQDTPNDLDALDLLGFTLFFQNRPTEAEATCRKALEIEPHRAYSTKGLGLCVARQGRVDEGIAFLREAIRLEPLWFDPRWDLAIVLADAQRWYDATEVLREAEIAIPTEKSRYAALRAEIARRQTLEQP